MKILLYAWCEKRHKYGHVTASCRTIPAAPVLANDSPALDANVSSPVVRTGLDHRGAVLLPKVVLDNQMRLPILNGENYVEWLELLELTLGCMNLDLAINEEKPEDLTDESTPDQRDYYAKWQRSNNMSLRLIKANMSRIIRRSIPDKPIAREYLDVIKKQYVSTDSSTVSTLIAKLGAIKYNESKDPHDYWDDSILFSMTNAGESNLVRTCNSCSMKILLYAWCEKRHKYGHVTASCSSIRAVPVLANDSPALDANASSPVVGTSLDHRGAVVNHLELARIDSHMQNTSITVPLVCLFSI
ncbi:hypothetical protein NE237_002067 [Protea cynaroides]|uniref:Uncharacterized protein n=1 Tax=Protea cynaroides TaxID=273540 RepID=A0A9Q0KUJ6_9MAGN|nr:hypothetical protein NE237_002067 [Protea cynaroides]